MSSTEQQRTGLDYLDSVTELLNRIRLTHPTAGLFEAAELQWWWAHPRETDDLGQLFWFDDDGRPDAAIIATDWNGSSQLDPLFLPDVTPERVDSVVRRGLEYASQAGIEAVSLEVDQDDLVLRAVLDDCGFAVEEPGLVESWMRAGDRPPISPLHDGYRLLHRLEAGARPHHMKNERRNHIDPEPRLRQTSLYQPELDLVIYDADDNVAAYGLFWYDPATSVGVVEPMRTNDDHQNRGLARHLLTVGIDRLVAAGAERLKICFEPDNPAAKHLYLNVGFVPDRHNDIFAGPTTLATT